MTDNDKIVKYMNKHQKVALFDYLQYYKGINYSLDDSEYNVQLASFDKNGFVLKYKDSGSWQQATIPFSPPLEHESDARTRFVQMAFTAADAFQVSPSRVKRYVCPTSLVEISLFLSIGLMMYVLICITFNLQWPYNFNVFGPKGTKVISRVTLVTLAIHVAELFFTVAPILRKYRAPIRAWVPYIFLTTVVGFPSWIPLKRKIAEFEIYRQKFGPKKEE